MTKVGLGWVAAIGAACLFAACSSSSTRLTTTPDGGAASCGAVAPCGGDLVGTWRVTQSCITATEDLGKICPGATAEIAFVIGGTATFNADGTYTSMPTGGPATVHEHFPGGCMPFGKSCDQLGLTTDGGVSVTCSIDSAGTCNCVGTEPESAPTPQSGTYTTSTSAQALTLMHDGGTSTANYCVKGSTLTEMVGPGDGAVVSMGAVVLTRQ